jgi:hypothetical protein
MRVRRSHAEIINDTLEAFLPTLFGIKRVSNGKKKELVYKYKDYTSSFLHVVTKWYFFYMDKDIRKEIESLTAEIAAEHYAITDGVDQNLNYLWYMYHKGSKAGTFKPFVFMAELQLLKKMGYTNDIEVQNMIKMLESSDEENIHLVTLAIKNYRDLRIQEHGEYSKINKAYWSIAKNYAFEVLNHDVFTKTMAVK